MLKRLVILGLGFLLACEDEVLSLKEIICQGRIDYIHPTSYGDQGLKICSVNIARDGSGNIFNLDNGSRIHYKEAKSRSEFSIEPGDSFFTSFDGYLIPIPLGQEPTGEEIAEYVRFSRLQRYLGFEDGKIVFEEDCLRYKIEVPSEGYCTRQCHLDPTSSRMNVDLDLDGIINGAEVGIHTQNKVVSLWDFIRCL